MFEEGAEYSRRNDIHGVFGGQQQGGISTPKGHPYVFIFTGKSGTQYGYEDGWHESEGVFLYTGEGQIGDMSFRAGNQAILNHVKNGKELLLFETLGKSKPVRFTGKFVCQSWDTFRGPDRDNNERKCIRFHLIPETEIAGQPTSPDTDQPKLGNSPTLEDLRHRALDAAVPQQSKNWGAAGRSYRARSKAVKDYVLARANGVCELTGRPAPFLTKSGQPYLEVHHIHRLSDDGPDDPRFVAAVCPAVHREIHFGEHGERLNEKLLEVIEAKEPL